MTGRTYSIIDELIINVDQGVRTVFGKPDPTARPHPAAELPEAELAEDERRLAEGLMRVDHAGEVCAQALYQGQALTARDPSVKERLAKSAVEENDHLLWCEQRLDELGGRTSWLNPFWYLGSLGIGAAAGLAGDGWSLGFLAETERQVVIHLDGHLARLPANDAKGRAVVAQMKEDEGRHATVAIKEGAADLPGFIKTLMSASSRVMTTLSYWL